MSDFEQRSGFHDCMVVEWSVSRRDREKEVDNGGGDVEIGGDEWGEGE